MTEFDKYRLLFEELSAKRQAARISETCLSQEEESKYASLLADIWWDLSDEEQAKLEHEFFS